MRKDAERAPVHEMEERLNGLDVIPWWGWVAILLALPILVGLGFVFFHP